MRRAWFGSVVFGASLLVGAACSLGPGEVLIDGEWSLEGLSPDGRSLLVAVPTGGCDRFESWEVVEADDAVTITARVRRDEGAGGCTSELIVDTLELELAEPIGDRPLRGCGRDDCFGGFEPYDQGLVFAGTVTAAGDVVAVEGEEGMALYVGGELVTSIGRFATGSLLGFDDGMIVRPTDGSRPSVRAYDGFTGELRWEAEGWAVAGDPDAVFVCRGEEGSGLAAVERSTGADRWESDAPCTISVLDGWVAAIIGDEAVDGGHRLAIVDAGTGEVVVDGSVFDGIADQVPGYGEVLAWGDRAVLAGVQGHLVVFGDDGTEIDRWPEAVGHPIGIAGDVLVAHRYDRGLTGWDLTTGEQLWQDSSIDGASAVSEGLTVGFGGGSFWTLSADGRSVERRAVTDGAVVWRAPIGSTSGMSVAVSGEVAYVLTTQTLFALDGQTGATRWSVDRSGET